MNVPERALRLSGATNFRDLGGYIGQDGRPTAWRRIFRSDHLGQLSQNDVSHLTALGLARVCDFRGVQERKAHSCALPQATVHALPIEPSVVQALEEFALNNGSVTGSDAVRLMQETYRAFVRASSARFAELFDHLLHDAGPLVFHCTAGKDRTGFAAALVLSALGVGRQAVMQDYLLTNALYRAPSWMAGNAPADVRDAIRRVQPDYLQASLDVVDQDFGGMQTYLTQTLGLGAAQRRRLYELYLQA